MSLLDPHPSDVASDCRRLANAILTVADLCVSRTESSDEVQYEVRAHEIGPVFEILARELADALHALDQAITARLPG